MNENLIVETVKNVGMCLSVNSIDNVHVQNRAKTGASLRIS